MDQTARTFHDILLEKLDVSREETAAAQTAPIAPETHSNTLAFESFFSQLHNTVDAFVSDALPGISLKKTPYAQAKATDAGAARAAKLAEKQARPMRPERTKIRSQLSAVEETALIVFAKYGATNLEKSEIIGETIIKKTYRKLAVTFHPDTNRGAVGATAFRELNEAYIILAKMFR